MKKLLHRIVVIINVVAAGGLLISTLAPLINPSRFFLPALFGLSYPYLLMVNLILVIYWLIKLKKELFISLVIILLGWNHLNNLLPLNFKESKIPITTDRARLFKVLSYNVRGFDIYHWSNDPNVKSEIFKLFEEQEPDILCLQEYYTSRKGGDTHRDMTHQLLSLPNNAVYYTENNVAQVGFGIATFSRYPIIRKSRIPFNSTGNAAMYTDILFRSDTIRVFNLHLQSIKFRQKDYAFMDTVKLKYSNQQMREIRDIGSQLKTAFTLRSEQATMISSYIKSSPHPVIIMGDFNDTPQSFTYRKIKKGNRDAFRKAGRGFGNTYAGELPSFRIDYILCSDPVIPYEFKRIKTSFSDHFPITSWFHLPGKAIAE